MQIKIMPRAFLGRLLILMTTVLGALGCNSWEPMEGWRGDAVWSDDDEAVAAVYEYYEGKNTYTHIRKRNYESEVHVFNPPGGPELGQRLVLARSPGRIDQLFFMKEAGYLIVRRVELIPEATMGLNTFSNISVDKVSLNGAVTSLGRTRAQTSISCDANGQSSYSIDHALSVFPSPDGNLLAKVDTTTTCQSVDVQLTFLDAHSLEVLDGPTEIFSPEDIQQPSTYAWQTDGRFAAIATFFGISGESYAPGTPPQRIQVEDYGCFYPSTTSSSVSADGRTITMDNGRPSISPHEQAEVSFGCP